MGKKPTKEEKLGQSRGPNLVYQLKVTLEGIRPLIWRRIQVTDEIRLDRFHQILQIVMGWTDIHLHEFVVNGISYGDTSMDTGRDMKNEKRFSLSKVLSVEKSKFSYIYDWGDYWEHEILLEKIIPYQKVHSYPVCLGGTRACPPENCGGPSGYKELVKILSDPSHSEHEERFGWLSGDFDTEKFDVAFGNMRLQSLGKKKKR
jgi:hypothetical protein